MKKVLCTICLLLISGCAVYHYQPGKTLEQCSQDSRECMYDANKHAYPVGAATLYYQCMSIRGYQKLSKEQLPAGVRTRQTDDYGFYYIAGK